MITAFEKLLGFDSRKHSVRTEIMMVITFSPLQPRENYGFLTTGQS